MHKFLLCILFVVSGTFELQAQSQAQSRAQPVDGFAAEVDGHIITVGDVVQRIRPALVQISREYKGKELIDRQTQLFEDGLENLIEQRLMISHFEKLKAELPATVLRDRKDSIMRERFNNNRDEFIMALRQIGKTEQEWEAEMREQLIAQSVLQQFVRGKIHVSPREVREAYEAKKLGLLNDVELKLRSIAFRPVPETETQTQREKMQQVMKLLAAGADFSDIARTYSEGPKAAQGGDEGWVNLSSLPDELKTGLIDRKPGELTPLIETPVQSYIFKIEDKRGGGTVSLADAQAGLQREIENQKYEALYSEFMQGLNNQFQVRRFNPDISAVTGDL